MPEFVRAHHAGLDVETVLPVTALPHLPEWTQVPDQPPTDLPPTEDATALQHALEPGLAEQVPAVVDAAEQLAAAALAAVTHPDPSGTTPVGRPSSPSQES